MLVSLTANTADSQKPKLYISDFLRIVEKEETFGKNYEQSFTDEVFELAHIPTLHTPMYSFFDADREVILGKFYQHELQLVRESPLQNGK